MVLTQLRKEAQEALQNVERIAPSVSTGLDDQSFRRDESLLKEARRQGSTLKGEAAATGRDAEGKVQGLEEAIDLGKRLGYVEALLEGQNSLRRNGEEGFLKPGDVVRLTTERRTLEREFDTVSFTTPDAFSSTLSQQAWDARYEGQAQGKRDTNAGIRASGGNGFVPLDANGRLAV